MEAVITNLLKALKYFLIPFYALVATLIVILAIIYFVSRPEPSSIGNQQLDAIAESLYQATAPPQYIAADVPLIFPLLHEPGGVLPEDKALCFSAWTRDQKPGDWENMFQITIDGKGYSLRDGNASSLLGLEWYDGYFYGGPVQGCYDLDLKPGLHVITVAVMVNTVDPYSYTWAFKVE